MPDNIETFYRTAYANFIRLEAMTQMSVLQDKCDQEQLQGEILMIDAYGTPTVTGITSRNQTSISLGGTTDVPRYRVQLTPSFYEHSELFNRQDKVKQMKDLKPDSQFGKAVVGALMKQRDLDILDAIIATVTKETNGDGGASVTFDNTNSYVVASAGGPDTTNGGTADKLSYLAETLETNRVSKSEPWFGVMHPEQKRQMMEYGRVQNDARIVSSDFRSSKPAETGEIGVFEGIEWCTSPDVEEFTTFSSDTDNPHRTGATNINGKYIYAWAQSGMVFAKDGDIEVHFDILPHYRHALQVAHYSSHGAVRTSELKVARAECANDAAIA